MELIDRIGGFGKIQVTELEHQKLQELKEIILISGQKYILGELNKSTGDFERLMRELFPDFPLVKGAGIHGMQSRNSYTTAWSKNHYHQDLPQSLELSIGSRLSVAQSGSRNDGDLAIIAPLQEGENEYFMSVIVEPMYQPNCVDDVVEVLGKREKPVIMGAQRIRNNSPVGDYFGVADVPRLGAVLDLYLRAAHLVEHAAGSIKVSSPELDTLRQDGVKHPNIALRELSQARYDQALRALTNQ